jgi:hypothetical protein
MIQCLTLTLSCSWYISTWDDAFLMLQQWQLMIRIKNPPVPLQQHVTEMITITDVTYFRLHFKLLASTLF